MPTGSVGASMGGWGEERDKAQGSVESVRVVGVGSGRMLLGLKAEGAEGQAFSPEAFTRLRGRHH